MHNMSKRHTASILVPPITIQAYNKNLNPPINPKSDVAINNNLILNSVLFNNSQEIKGQRRFIKRGVHKGEARRELTKMYKNLYFWGG